MGFVRRERAVGIRPSRGYWLGAPDLVVESRSPNDQRSKLRAQAEEWLAHGARAVWWIEPEKAVLTVYRADATRQVLTDNDTLVDDGLLPGFRHRVGDLLALPSL